MPVQKIILNGIPYAAKDIEVSFLGRPVVAGVTEINFSESTEVEKTYVLGQKAPIARTTGKENGSGDVAILLNELAGIEIAAGSSISDVSEFPITITYKALPVPLKQTLSGCIVVDKSQTATGGDAKAIVVKLKLDIMKIGALQAL